MASIRRPVERLSAAQVRRIALAAQGFADPRPPGAVTGRAVRRLFDRVGLVQIDSVNVLSRAHYLPLFSRAGAYDRAVLDRAAHYAPRRLFEYWGHEASLIPVGLQPALRWRMERAADDAWGGMRRIQRDRPELIRDVLEEVRATGPVAASAVMEHERPKRTGPWWDWSDVKRAMEWLFWSGQVTSARRRGFERLYDLPERVLPPEVLAAPTPPVEEAQRELLRVAARSLGVGTESDLRDYFRLPAAEAQAPRRRARRGRGAVGGRGRGLAPAGPRPPRRALPAPGRRARARRAVRLADLGAAARRARVRLPLPDRDLRARAEARARVLRAPVPAGRPARGARRPEGRSPGQRAARPGRARRAGRAAGDRRGAARAARGDGRHGWGSSGSTSSRAATSRRRSPAPPASSRCARPPSPRARPGSRRRRSRAAG